MKLSYLLAVVCIAFVSADTPGVLTSKAGTPKAVTPKAGTKASAAGTAPAATKAQDATKATITTGLGKLDPTKAVVQIDVGS